MVTEPDHKMVTNMSQRHKEAHANALPSWLSP